VSRRDRRDAHPNAPREGGGEAGGAPLEPSGRVLPHSIEAERSVLGGMLMSPKAVWIVAELIQRPSDFYHPAHAAIFDAMLQLSKAQIPIDPIAVAEKMREADTFGKLRAVNGEAYFVELMSDVVTIENIGFHARMVQGKATVRRLIEAAQEIAAHGYGQYGDVSEFVANAQRSIAEVAQVGAERSIVHARTVAAEVRSKMLARRGRGTGLVGIPTGYHYLDSFIGGLEPATLVVMAGRPSMGKSSLVRGMCIGAMQITGVPVLWFSPEMTRANVVQNAVFALAGINTRQTDFTGDEWAKIEHALSQIEVLPWHIDDGASPSLMEICVKARRWRNDDTKGARLRLCRCGHARGWHFGPGGACSNGAGCADECHQFEAKDDDLGPAIIVLDYLQRGKMEKESPGENDAKSVGRYVQGLKTLAKELNLCFIVVSSLSRAVEQRQDKRPVSSDLRESGDIEYEADVIGMVYRDEVYNPDTNDKGIAEVIFVKQRNGPIGPVHLCFINQYTRFENLTIPDRSEMEQQPMFDANGTNPARTKKGGGKGNGKNRGRGNQHATAGEDHNE